MTNPEQYDTVLEELTRHGRSRTPTRHDFARAAFAHTVELTTLRSSGGSTSGGDIGERRTGPTEAVLAPTLHLSLERCRLMRYGENPHQVGARYRLAGTTPWWDGVIQHAGTALSYLNLFDADAAWRLVHELRPSTLPE